MRWRRNQLAFALLFVAGCADILGISEPHSTSKTQGDDAGEGGMVSAEGGAGGDEGRVTDAGEGGAPGMGGEVTVAGSPDTGSPDGAGMGGASDGGGGFGGIVAGGGATGGGGHGGGPIPEYCASIGERRCAGPSSPPLTPQICSGANTWIRNLNENSGNDCPLLCETGRCVKCTANDVRCDHSVPQKCIDGDWVAQASPCADYCSVQIAAGAAPEARCFNAPSCNSGAPLRCGQDSCCLSLEVTGGTFNRSNLQDSPATISTFSMDKYEVTMARFARFVERYYHGSTKFVLNPGDGKSPVVAGDPGWTADYSLPSSYEAMIEQLKCATEGSPPNGPAGGAGGSGGTTSEAGGSPGDSAGMGGTGGASAGAAGQGGGTSTLPPNVNATFFSNSLNLPANCVDFYSAYAFCIADGGRLPTEAEWNYAAAGGVQQRYYPWSPNAADHSIDHTRAVYLAARPEHVGSYPLGAGPFQHMDLAGNVAEWTLDLYTLKYSSVCSDCLATTGTYRVSRGGGYDWKPDFVTTAYRAPQWPSFPHTNQGFRCVHDSKTTLK